MRAEDLDTVLEIERVSFETAHHAVQRGLQSATLPAGRQRDAFGGHGAGGRRGGRFCGVGCVCGVRVVGG